jgi:hypothetical protein
VLPDLRLAPFVFRTGRNSPDSPQSIWFHITEVRNFPPCRQSPGFCAYKGAPGNRPGSHCLCWTVKFETHLSLAFANP